MAGSYAARSRLRQVLHGAAEHIPLPDAVVDVVHARFAYFFPPGCDAGLAEVLRVLRPQGTLVVVDNDHRNGEFAELLGSSSWAAPQGTAAVIRAIVDNSPARRTRPDDWVQRLSCPGGVASSSSPTTRARTSGSCCSPAMSSAGPPTQVQVSSQSAETSHDRSAGNIRSGSAP